MSRESRVSPGRMFAVAIAVLVATAIGLAAAAAGRLPEGPVDVAWDREVCAHCTMLVSDRAFAAQLQTRDADILNFDDPGCLFQYEVARRPPVHALYFRHVREDRWIPGDRASFERVEPTPMGFGLGAVDEGSARPGASIPLGAARAEVLSGAPAGAGG